MNFAELPAEVEGHELLDEDAWIALRDAGITPLHQSELVTTARDRAEFLVGAWLLGLLDSVQPQMLRVVDALAAGKLMNAVIMPRRSSKTTTLFCILLGRCYLRPVHMAGFTLLTTQKKTAERFRLDIYGPISRRWPAAATETAFAKGAPVRLFKGSGTERVEFGNGSVLAALSPEGDAIRSGAYDTVLADESGEATLQRWEDVISAVIPAFDTRPEGQLILAGTAGDYRGSSEFWKTLHDPEAGVIRYTLPDDINPEELQSWEPTEDNPLGHAGELVEQMHPGLFGLTTIDRLRNGYDRLGVVKFTREYFGIFGSEGSNVALIPAPSWTAAGLPLASLTKADKPAVSTIAFMVHPDGAAASLVQAWKDEDGRYHIGLMHHQVGMKNLAKNVLLAARKVGRPIVFDSASAATSNIMREIAQARPAPGERPLVSADIKRSAVRFTSVIREDQLRHYGQVEVDAAAGIAVKRAFGTGSGWAFGRPDPRKRPGDDITPIEAAAMAVYALDSERAYRSPVDDLAGV